MICGGSVSHSTQGLGKSSKCYGYSSKLFGFQCSPIPSPPYLILMSSQFVRSVYLSDISVYFYV